MSCRKLRLGSVSGAVKKGVDKGDGVVSVDTPDEVTALSVLVGEGQKVSGVAEG
jgi:hypothetical protein